METLISTILVIILEKCMHEDDKPAQIASIANKFERNAFSAVHVVEMFHGDMCSAVGSCILEDRTYQFCVRHARQAYKDTMRYTSVGYLIESDEKDSDLYPRDAGKSVII